MCALCCSRLRSPGRQSITCSTHGRSIVCTRFDSWKGGKSNDHTNDTNKFLSISSERTIIRPACIWYFNTSVKEMSWHVEVLHQFKLMRNDQHMMYEICTLLCVRMMLGRSWWEMDHQNISISHLLAWQAWAETEGGLVRGLASYCLDRFQRFDKSRHKCRVDRIVLLLDPCFQRLVVCSRNRLPRWFLINACMIIAYAVGSRTKNSHSRHRSMTMCNYSSSFLW